MTRFLSSDLQATRPFHAALVHSCFLVALSAISCVRGRERFSCPVRFRAFLLAERARPLVDYSQRFRPVGIKLERARVNPSRTSFPNRLSACNRVPATCEFAGGNLRAAYDQSGSPPQATFDIIRDRSRAIRCRSRRRRDRGCLARFAIESEEIRQEVRRSEGTSPNENENEIALMGGIRSAAGTRDRRILCHTRKEERENP